MEQKKIAPCELLCSLEQKCFEAAQEQSPNLREEEWIMLSNDLDWIAHCFKDHFDRHPYAHEWIGLLGYAPDGVTQPPPAPVRFLKEQREAVDFECQEGAESVVCAFIREFHRLPLRKEWTHAFGGLWLRYGSQFFAEGTAEEQARERGEAL